MRSCRDGFGSATDAGERWPRPSAMRHPRAAAAPTHRSIRMTAVDGSRGGVTARRSGLAAQPAVLLVGLILFLDLAWSVISSSTAPSEFGLFDEPAHLGVALLLLMVLAVGLGRRLSPAFIAAALIASVAIDLDHIPGYLGWDALVGTAPRPHTHSLLTPAVLVLVAALTHGRARQIAAGTAFGVCAHFFRDLATGPGVPLFWPIWTGTIRVPYVLFVVGLAFAAAFVVSRKPV